MGIAMITIKASHTLAVGACAPPSTVKATPPIRVRATSRVARLTRLAAAIRLLDTVKTVAPITVQPIHEITIVASRPSSPVEAAPPICVVAGASASGCVPNFLDAVEGIAMVAVNAGHGPRHRVPSRLVEAAPPVANTDGDRRWGRVWRWIWRRVWRRAWSRRWRRCWRWRWCLQGNVGIAIWIVLATLLWHEKSFMRLQLCDLVFHNGILNVVRQFCDISFPLVITILKQASVEEVGFLNASTSGLRIRESDAIGLAKCLIGHHRVFPILKLLEVAPT